MFIHPRVPEVKELDGQLYEILLSFLASAGKSMPVLYSVIAYMLFYVQAIAFNKILNDQRLFPRTNYLAGMSYLLITSVFNEWAVLSAPLVVNTLLIWVLSNLCNLYNNPHVKTTLFNTGFITGMASLFYLPSLVFAILIVVGLVITRPFKLPEWLVALVGILSPYYFMASWLFLTNRWNRFQFPPITVTLPRFHETAWAYTGIILVLFVVSTGFFFIRNNSRRLILQSRKSWSLVYLYFGVALLVPFFNASSSFEYWILAAIPAAAFAAGAFLFPERKWFALVFHWGMVAVSVITGYFIR